MVDTPGNSRGGFPNTTAGTFFSGAFSDHAVLQRGPAKAAVYGVVIGATPGTTVQVTVASTDVSGAPPPPLSVSPPRPRAQHTHTRTRTHIVPVLVHDREGSPLLNAPRQRDRYQ